MNSKIEIILRLILAIALLVFGLNKFIGFIPMEAPPEGSFMDALIKTGYMMPLIGLSEVIPGLLLLLNKYKGFALLWLVPISVNIIAFHLRFDITTIGPAAVIGIINALLIYMNWNRFKPLFS